jgi:uncharacterized protein (DUF1684 family)
MFEEQGVEVKIYVEFFLETSGDGETEKGIYADVGEGGAVGEVGDVNSAFL